MSLQFRRPPVVEYNGLWIAVVGQVAHFRPVAYLSFNKNSLLVLAVNCINFIVVR